ncbi:hypothetical protein ABZ478_14330 [Streptomyces sp. NPDC005706]|uniref:hypothetical protein n=1 Tax=Streptomyces sp. NPDC005706 TaxID=3157169 RepID=UPI00340E4685
MGDVAEKPEAVRGGTARSIKREDLGIGDRSKHPARKATPLKGHVKGTDTRHFAVRTDGPSAGMPVESL